MAHTSNVNCLKIGRKTSRILLTGGEDQKVNLWAIGKPNAILVRQSPPKLYDFIVAKDYIFYVYTILPSPPVIYDQNKLLLIYSMAIG